MRVTVLLSKEEGEIFEAYCAENGFKKSTLINRLIREHIENKGFQYQKELFTKTSAGGEEK